jgi:hypothetical protein
MTSGIVDYDGYGYYCDPGYVEQDYINPHSKKHRGYYTYNHYINTIHEEIDSTIEEDEDRIYTIKSNQSFNDKINTYKKYLTYGFIIMGSFTITTLYVYYGFA